MSDADCTPGPGREPRSVAASSLLLRTAISKAVVAVFPAKHNMQSTSVTTVDVDIGFLSNFSVA